MRSLTAVDVGDGACSVLVGDDMFRMFPEVGVVDCGCFGEPHERAAQKLADTLGPRVNQLRSIVVSHLDADHWEGFRYLPFHVTPMLPSLDVYVPAVPVRLSTALRAFVTPRSEDGSVTSLLRRSLIRLLQPGHSPRVIPTVECDVVVAGGMELDVLWPPRRLGPEMQRAVDGAVAAVDTLAGRLREAGSDGLTRALDDLRSGEGEQDFPEPDGSENTGGFGPHVLEGVDEAVFGSLRQRAVRVFRRVREVNNDLSLILLARDNSVLLPGDAGETVLRHVLGRPEVARRTRDLQVMLAPGHGSRGTTADALPPARLCITQTGPRHRARWRAHHLGRHSESGCVCLSGLHRLTATW